MFLTCHFSWAKGPILWLFRAGTIQIPRMSLSLPLFSVDDVYSTREDGDNGTQEEEEEEEEEESNKSNFNSIICLFGGWPTDDGL